MLLTVSAILWLVKETLGIYDVIREPARCRRISLQHRSTCLETETVDVTRGHPLDTLTHIVLTPIF